MNSSASIRPATPDDEAQILTLMNGFCESEGKSLDEDRA